MRWSGRQDCHLSSGATDPGRGRGGATEHRFYVKTLVKQSLRSEHCSGKLTMHMGGKLDTHSSLVATEIQVKQ